MGAHRHDLLDWSIQSTIRPIDTQQNDALLRCEISILHGLQLLRLFLGLSRFVLLCFVPLSNFFVIIGAIAMTQ